MDGRVLGLSITFLRPSRWARTFSIFIWSLLYTHTHSDTCFNSHKCALLLPFILFNLSNRVTQVQQGFLLNTFDQKQSIAVKGDVSAKHKLVCIIHKSLTNAQSKPSVVSWTLTALAGGSLWAGVHWGHFSASYSGVDLSLLSFSA